VFTECLAPDCIIHGIGGPSDIKAILQEFHKSFPDLVATVDEQIAEDDKVVTRWTWRGTHTGELQSPYRLLAPTGKTITYTGIRINRVVDNKIVEDRFEADLLGLWEQLGAIPSGTADA